MKETLGLSEDMSQEGKRGGDRTEWHELQRKTLL